MCKVGEKGSCVMRSTPYVSFFIHFIRLLLAVSLSLNSLPLTVISAASIANVPAATINESRAAATVAPVTLGVIDELGAGDGLRDLTAMPLAAAPVITATKRDTLVGDVDGDTKADPGDTLRYTVVIKNSGTSDA